MRKAVEQETLQRLVKTGVAREFCVLRDGDGWRLGLRLGASGAQARGASLCATGVGIKVLTVESDSVIDFRTLTAPT